MNKNRNWGWLHSSACDALALHTANPGSVPSISCGSLSTAGVTPECIAKYSPKQLHLK